MVVNFWGYWNVFVVLVMPLLCLWVFHSILPWLPMLLAFPWTLELARTAKGFWR